MPKNPVFKLSFPIYSRKYAGNRVRTRGTRPYFNENNRCLIENGLMWASAPTYDICRG